MAFEFYQDDMNTSPQLTYVKATENEAYTPGELLKIGSAGTATKASGTDAPQYVCHQINGKAAEGDLLQVVRIQKNHKYKTTLAAAGTALVVGQKVTIHTDGAQATATTTGGVLEIVEMMGTTVGSEIIVRI